MAIAAPAVLKKPLAAFGQTRLVTIFKIPELRRKILITVVFLAIYRIGFHVPLPIIDQQQMMRAMRGSDEGLLGLISMFSGGSLSQSTIFGLGIMPYISASIFFQLFATIYPPLEKLQKEGEAGRKKINEYTRYATVLICMVQAWMWVSYMTGPQPQGLDLALRGFNNSLYYKISSVLMMTTGTIFLMWIGEQIDEYGIGNGISLIIMAGIVARIPAATASLFFEGGHFKSSVFTLGGGTSQDISFEKLVVLIALFVTVVVAVVAITKAQLLRTKRDLLKPEVIWNIEQGLKLTIEQIERAEAQRVAMTARALEFFKTYDLLLCPATIVSPFPIQDRYVGECDGRKFDNYVEWLGIVYAITLACCPALSLPCGFTASGLPIGLQMVAPPRGEAQLLAGAKALEDILGVRATTPIDPRVAK